MEILIVKYNILLYFVIKAVAGFKPSLIFTCNSVLKKKTIIYQTIFFKKYCLNIILINSSK